MWGPTLGWVKRQRVWRKPQGGGPAGDDRGAGGDLVTGQEGWPGGGRSLIEGGKAPT